jgi:NAD(P)H-hydrate epimerase
VELTFQTDRGVIVPAVTADEMREVDRIAVEETGPNLFQMMENAGRNLASVAISMLGESWRSASVVVLAGTGGNGGGGIAAGRHLANRGASVTTLVTDPDGLTPVAAAQFETYRHAGGTVASSDGVMAAPDLIIDSLIGYSLRDAPRDVAARFIDLANDADAPVLALDVPSGVDATTGETPGVAVKADTTMTLALPKTGLTGRHIGRLLLADIGIPAAVYLRIGRPLDAALFDDRWVMPLQRV